jgi:hypothetical protein
MSAQRNGVPQATLEALAYQLRGGPAALRDPSAQRRLFELSETQVKEIAERLTKANLDGTAKVPPWDETEITAIVDLWSNRHAV